MTSNVDEKTKVGLPRSVAVIGSSIAAVQSAFTLAQLGIEVKLITSSMALGYDIVSNDTLESCSPDQRFLWPLLLRTINHPLVTLYCGAEVEAREGSKGDFKVRIRQQPRYVNKDFCTGCARCQDECSGRVVSPLNGQKVAHTTIHKPLLRAKTIPSAYVIDKNGFAPCHVSCPLGINVQGFVSLLANGKTDGALALIHEASPLSGILGRVCRHPCESSCNRGEVDDPVFIRALHRYAADNASSAVHYKSKLPAQSRLEKVAIVGSGPAGLTAAWELARRGYVPTIFESHGVIGGMLATGIPRFRLPHEIREKDITAIKRLGIDIRTGITVGRDVDFAYLRERGFHAFFLAIGAQRNNRLDIPGEELEGVVDCMSLLLTLNLMVDTFVGSNILIIGDGNSAVDSARTAIRRNKGSVKILSWTVPEELTAGEEEVKEALLEGILFEYRAIPVEILGDGTRVTGVRCQRTELTEEIMPNGRHRPKPIPGTDFVMDVDHVIVAVGQSPDALQLNIEDLATDGKTGVIKVNPLTLETNVAGTFAGGDCVTGPNNVVEAMAAGLRAAESIDRYIRKRDLGECRSLEPLQTVEIDIKKMEVSPYKRASMPAIRFQKRLGTLEETTTGLSAETALREAQRCLRCAFCSQCMECARVCIAGAVFHNDSIRHLELAAQSILEFPSSDLGDGVSDSGANQGTTTEGVQIVSFSSNASLTTQLTRAMAVAFESAIEIGPTEEETRVHRSVESNVCSDQVGQIKSGPEDRVKRVGVFLCSCGSSISSVIDFKSVAQKLSDLYEVAFVLEITQACTEAGAEQIANQIAESKLDQVVLAACRCCDLDRLCYSCTDRRMMCRRFLKQHLALPDSVIVEFVNIREQCAWVHKDDPKGATYKATQLILAAVSRTNLAPVLGLERTPILRSVLIVGGALVGITAAGALLSQGYQVDLVANKALGHDRQIDGEVTTSMLEQLQGKGVTFRPWPDSFELRGSPGNYEAMLWNGSQIECLLAGAVLVDMFELNKATSPLSNMTSVGGLLGRVLSRQSNSCCSAGVQGDLIREVAVTETSGIFLMPSDDGDLAVDRVLQGLATAARISSYLEQGAISPRAMSVEIDSKRCRGCGNCAVICSYVEMKERSDGISCAYIDKALCSGCGACITSCQAGAITQPGQSDRQIISAVLSVLQRS
jgi:NADPH-dependent glutamate synthase beta subunit-like oxidoreductase/NAD-dependent dihydropyrimidine dehydrogenase PreA subunit